VAWKSWLFWCVGNVGGKHQLTAGAGVEGQNKWGVARVMRRNSGKAMVRLIRLSGGLSAVAADWPAHRPDSQ
jgi:hypothetical protein